MTDEPKRNGGRRTILTPELRSEIVRLVRGGAFDYIAAEANGIAQATFYKWMKRGEDAVIAADDEQTEQTEIGPEDTPYVEFMEAIQEARAFARSTAEVKVWRDDPKWYLTHGPGRDRPGRPGWTAQIEVKAEVQHSGTIEHNLDADTLLASLLKRTDPPAETGAGSTPTADIGEPD